MKIAFITGCLEFGKDGVGDYTRLLAEECVKHGCKGCLLSLNDRFITKFSQSEIVADKVRIPMLRLPVNMPWSQRIVYAKNFLTLCQPDWISLQFVSYAYQDKGIVINLSKWLRPLIQGRQLHIMFHELWIGQHLGAKLKERLVGTVQKIFIWRLVRQLHPTVVHTSNSTYVAMLKQIGIPASRLPIFGNISISEKNGDDWLFPKLQNLGLDVQTKNRSLFWLFGFFGTIHPTWPAEPLFTYLQQAEIRHQRKIAIISIGRLGGGEKLWESLSKTYCFQFVFLSLGEHSPGKVSEFFNSIDVGIATSPYLLVGKSGTVAAMLEHGLPVIVNADDFQLASCSIPLQEKDPLLYKLNSCTVDKLADKLGRAVPQSQLKNTTKQFLKNLTEK